METKCGLPGREQWGLVAGWGPVAGCGGKSGGQSGSGGPAAASKGVVGRGMD